MAEPAITGMETDLSDSEWEYEYDTQETETFYVTLDLSSATNEALSRIERGKSRATAETAGVSSQDSPANGRPTAEGSISAAARKENASPRIQFLELGSENPFVSFDGHLYSCSWSRTIGTDLIFAGPGEQLPFEPVYREPGFQIAALSDIRLVGSTVKLVPKQTTTTSENSTSHLQSRAGISIPLTATAGNDRRKQAAFLERIAAVKREKGDKDEVYIAKGKSYADFLPRHDPSHGPIRQPASTAKTPDTDRKGKGKAVAQPLGNGTESSEDATALLNVSGSNLAIDAQGGEPPDEGDEDQLPTVTTRTLRRREARKDAGRDTKGMDVEMRDAG